MWILGNHRNQTMEPLMRNTDPNIRPLAHSVSDALALVPVGRSLLYEEIKAGRLKIFKIGTRTLIADEDLKAWLREFQRNA
jgi:excisionase family DNA binding protein